MIYLDTDKKKRFIIDTIFYGFIIILIMLACKFVIPVLIPFILAFIIASIIRLPIRRFYGKHEWKNKMISIVTCLIFYIAFFTVVCLIGVRLYHSLAGLLSSLPNTYNSIFVPAVDATVSSIENLLSNFDIDVNIKLGKLAKEHIGTLGEYITSFSANAIVFISSKVTQIPGFVIKLVIMIISTFFCMIDYNKITVFFIGLIPKNKTHMVREMCKYFKNTVFLYLKSYLLLFILTFIELCVGFLIMHIDYALLLAFLVAIFDILPILGVGGVLLPWSAIGFITSDLRIGIGMLALYLVIAFVRNMTEPKLIGNQIGLHPLATLISMYLGLRFFGFIGMFLFPVSLSVIVGIKTKKEATHA